jgi:hypothetical protein
MLTRNSLACTTLMGSVLFATVAFAQSSKGLPSAELIANADKFNPPTLSEYAAGLAQQPDMTGTWMAMVPKGAGNGPTFDPVHTFYPPALARGEATFGPLPGTYIKGIPYNAEYEKKYRELIKETTEGKSRDTFPACVPYGVPRMIGDSPTPLDIIQTPDVMIWYDNYGRTERRIFLSERTHRIDADPETGGTGPSLSGNSIAHWEGNTLLIDTVNMLGAYFDETPAPYSDQLHMVERVRLIAPDILEDQMTFTDPVTMTKPWIVTRYFRRNAGKREYLELNDRPCVPNVKIDKNGFQVAILPSELDEDTTAPSSNSPTKGAPQSATPPKD